MNRNQLNKFEHLRLNACEEILECCLEILGNKKHMSKQEMARKLHAVLEMLDEMGLIYDINEQPTKPLDIEKMTGVPQWHHCDEPPEAYLKIVVKDADGNEYGGHYWDGCRYWEFTENDDGTQDGFRSHIDVCEWKYCSYKQ